MTLATMTDRSLPLAERVKMVLDMRNWVDASVSVADATTAINELLADVAAADRLARAALALGMTGSAWDMRSTLEYKPAFDAYRARMQGVGDV